MKFSEYERLRFERRDNGVLLITMDRPDKYNAADEQMHGELARVWAEVSADPQTRVAVITGAGKAFSAGGDLEMVRGIAGDDDRVAHMLREMSDLVYNVISWRSRSSPRSTASPSAPARWWRCWPTSRSAPSTPGSVTDTSS